MSASKDIVYALDEAYATCTRTLLGREEPFPFPVGYRDPNGGFYVMPAPDGGLRLLNEDRGRVMSNDLFATPQQVVMRVVEMALSQRHLREARQTPGRKGDPRRAADAQTRAAFARIGPEWVEIFDAYLAEKLRKSPYID